MDIEAIVAAAGIVEGAIADTERPASCEWIRSDLRPLSVARRASGCRRRRWSAASARSQIVQHRIRVDATYDDGVRATWQARLRDVAGKVAHNRIRNAGHHRAGRIDDRVAATKVRPVP